MNSGILKAGTVQHFGCIQHALQAPVQHMIGRAGHDIKAGMRISVRQFRRRPEGRPAGDVSVQDKRRLLIDNRKIGTVHNIRQFTEQEIIVSALRLSDLQNLTVRDHVACCQHGQPAACVRLLCLRQRRLLEAEILPAPGGPCAVRLRDHQRVPVMVEIPAFDRHG